MAWEWRAGLAPPGQPWPTACSLSSRGHGQCSSWLRSRGGPQRAADCWGRKSRPLRVALAGTAMLLSKPLSLIPEAEPHASLPRRCCHATVAVLPASLLLSNPIPGRSRRVGSHRRQWAWPDVLSGRGRMCSAAWRRPISEAALRLTDTRWLVPSPRLSGTFLKFLLSPCLCPSVTCALSLLPDTPTPCQSLPGAFSSARTPRSHLTQWGRDSVG